MGYNSGNNAYDLSLFEPRDNVYVRTNAEAGVSRAGGKSTAKRSGSRSRTATPERRKETKQERERRSARTKLARGLAIGIMLVIGVTIFIKGQVQHHELTREIEKASVSLTELEQEYEALKVKFDTKMSDSAVEEYAVNELGMQKRENSQTEYISLNVGSVFEIADEESDDWYQTNIERILSYTD